MTDGEVRYVIQPKPTSKWKIVLVALLVVGSLALIMLAGYLSVRNAEERQDQLLRENHGLLVDSARLRAQLARLDAKSNRITLESSQEQLKLQLCALRPGTPVCRGVAKDAHKVSDAIDSLQTDLTHVVRVTAAPPVPKPEPKPAPEPKPEPSPTPVPSPTSPPPHVGNSDQCPPHNPQCGGKN